MKKKSKIAIFGVDGYIGSNLHTFFRDTNEYETIKFSGKNEKGMNHFNLLNPQVIFEDQKFNKNDVAIFLAGISSPDECINNYKTAYQINVVGTRYTIKNLLRIGVKVIFFSSDTVYGKSNEYIFDENSPINPYGAYAEMKSIVEDSFFYDPNFITLRLSYVFSFEDKYTKYLLKNKEIKVVYEPYYRSVIYIDDVILTVERLINSWPKINRINVCGPNLVSRVEIAEKIKSNVKPDLEFTVKYPGDSFYYSRPPKIFARSLFLKNILRREPLNLAKSIIIEKEKKYNES